MYKCLVCLQLGAPKFWSTKRRFATNREFGPFVIFVEFFSIGWRWWHCPKEHVRNLFCAQGGWTLGDEVEKHRKRQRQNKWGWNFIISVKFFASAHLPIFFIVIFERDEDTNRWRTLCKPCRCVSYPLNILYGKPTVCRGVILLIFGLTVQKRRVKYGPTKSGTISLESSSPRSGG